MKITVRHYLLLGLLVCFILLSIYSFLMMEYFQFNENPRFQLPKIVTLHLIWYGIGGIGLLGAFFFGRAYPHCFSNICLGFAVSILGSAFLIGKVHHGLPYLYLGMLCINATEVSGLAFLIPLGFFMAHFRNHFLMILPPGILLLLFLLIGSDNATMCLGLVVTTLAWIIYREKRKAYNLLLILFSVCLTVIPFLKGVLFWNRNQSEVVPSLYRFVLYDFTADANGHTEFILSHIVERFGIISALGCITLILLFIAQLSILASTLINRASAFSWISFAVFLLGQTIFNLLVMIGALKNPSSGVFLPFVSYGGSQLVIQLIVMGGLIAFCDEKKISVASEIKKTKS